MKLSFKKLPKSQVELKIEIPAKDFSAFFEKAIEEAGKDLEIQGFRKGKAPKEIVEKTVGLDKILMTAAEEAVKENYQKAILEKEIETISQPQIEILKLAKDNPFEFQAKVWVLPEFELGDYKKIASQAKKREVKVTEEEIQRLKKEKERWEKERLRSEILEKIAEKTKIEIPEVLLEQEKLRILENLKRGVAQTLQISFKEYLSRMQKTEKEFLESLLPEAKKRIKTSLVLKEIIEKENISVTEKETEDEMKKLSSSSHLDQKQLKEYTKEVLRNQKTLEFLEKFVK
jgi:FKBP-type peptidyl-prolyl cis-trans isomerase (trigger factor)